MKFVAIDIETTGLDPKLDQILQFGAVIADTEKGILDRFQCNFVYERIRGNPYAISNMSVNHELIMAMDGILKTDMSELSKHNDMNPRNIILDTTRLDTYQSQFEGWYNRFLTENDIIKTPSYAGKNIAMFDLPFIWGAGIKLKARHRLLDPAILYYQEGDETLPDHQTLLQRVGVEKKVAHSAVEDAEDIANLILHKLSPNLSIYSVEETPCE